MTQIFITWYPVDNNHPVKCVCKNLTELEDFYNNVVSELKEGESKAIFIKLHIVLDEDYILTGETVLWASKENKFKIQTILKITKHAN